MQILVAFYKEIFHFIAILFASEKKLECVVLSTTYVLIQDPTVSVHQQQNLLWEQIVLLIISSLMEQQPLVIYQMLSIQRISFVALFSVLMKVALLLDLFVVRNQNIKIKPKMSRLICKKMCESQSFTSQIHSILLSDMACHHVHRHSSQISLEST